jgi:hypothetical protein
MQGDRGKAAWSYEERISEMNVDLGHHQCGKQFGQLRGDFPHFHDHNFANAESDVLFPEQFLHPPWITHDNPRDGRVGGFRHAEGHHVSFLGVEQFYEIQHCPHLVRQENRKLLHERSFNLRSCFRQVDGHMSKHGAEKESASSIDKYLTVDLSLANAM